MFKIQTKAITFIGALALTFSGQLFSQTNSNWSVGYLVSAELEATDGFTSTADVSSITLSYNQNISDAFTVEYELGLGIGSDDIEFSSGFVCILDSCTAELEHHYGIYGSYTFTNQSDLSPYVKIGLSAAKIDVNGTKESDNGISYGVGVTIGSSFQLEYLNYYDKDGISLTGITLNYLFN